VNWSKFTYEGDDQETILALRTKLPGSRFVKLVVGDKTILRGYYDIEVPSDFNVELCEEWAGEMYILYPYGVSSFSFQGIKFKSHPWISPSEYRDPEWSDGVMVLTKSIEYRAKKVPTEEVTDHGVWEVAYGIRYGTGTAGLLLIRPRPGKRSKTRDQAIRNLKSVVPSRYILDSLPKFSRPVIVKEVGEYVRSIDILKDGIILDPGIRKKPTLPPLETTRDEVRVVRRPDSIVPYSSPAVLPKQAWDTKLQEVGVNRTGSKLLIVDERGCFAMIEEHPDKPHDFPGGERKLGETPHDCLVREIYEELDVDISFTPLKYLGKSATTLRADSSVEASCDLFAVKADDIVTKMTGIDRIVLGGRHLYWCSPYYVASLSTIESSYVPPWVGRLCRFIQKLYPTVELFLDMLEGKSGPIPVIDYDDGKIAKKWEVPFPDDFFPIRTYPNYITGEGVREISPELPGTAKWRLQNEKPSLVPLTTEGVTVLVPSSTVKTRAQALLRPVSSPGKVSDEDWNVVGVDGKPLPARMSYADMVSRRGCPFSDENIFYYVATKLSGTEFIRTKDLYAMMTGERIDLNRDPPGKVIEALVKKGWLNRSPATGGHHNISLNPAWHPY